MKAMILAAGRGERMRPLTRRVPKPLLMAGGKSLLQHQVEKLARNGFRELVINHAYLGQQIEEALGDGGALGASIRYSREGEPLETAGGILKALPLLGPEAFVVVNADIWTDFPFASLPAVNGEDVLACLVMAPNPPHNPKGDFVLSEDGRLSEPRQESEQTSTFSGIAVYHPRLFAGMKTGKASIVPLLRKAMALNKARGLHYEGEWMDIGTPARLRALDEKLRAAAKQSE